MSNLEVHTYPLGLIETNAFLILNRDKQEALLIDAPHDAYKVITDQLKQFDCKLKGLVITHGHWDHMGDAALFQQDGVTIYAHEADQMWIENPSVFSFFMPPEVPEILPVKIDKLLGHEDKVRLLGEEMEVRHVPGHAPGNILLYLPSEKWAFVGDVIFAGSVGRYDLPGSNAKDLVKSIRNQVYTLPDDTIIYSGHGPETTVGHEKLYNPVIQGK